MTRHFSIRRIIEQLLEPIGDDGNRGFTKDFAVSAWNVYHFHFSFHELSAAVRWLVSQFLVALFLCTKEQQIASKNRRRIGLDILLGLP